MTKRIRSRILEYLPQKALQEMYDVCVAPESDNNIKVDLMIAILTKHNIDFVELGPGTNRLAVLIDNYVFKIALDKWGLQDNANEFVVSQELQPYVVKTYETNDLISVCEYITVISKEEFIASRDAIRSVLSIIAEGYLLGDVGTVPKNFANWGYRDNGDLVILDYAYIYPVHGEEMLCSKDQTLLEYDENFHTLKCPTCHKKYSFMDVRRRITMEQEEQEIFRAKQLAYKVTKPVEEFTEGYTDDGIKQAESVSAKHTSSLYNKEEKDQTFDNNKEEKSMRNDKFNIDSESREEAYLDVMNRLKQYHNPEIINPTMGEADEATTQTMEIQKQTADAITLIKVVRQSLKPDGGTVDSDTFVSGIVSDIQETVQGMDMETDFIMPTLEPVARIDNVVNDTLMDRIIQESKANEEPMQTRQTHRPFRNEDDEDAYARALNNLGVVQNGTFTSLVEEEVIHDNQSEVSIDINGDGQPEIEIHTPGNLTVEVDGDEDIDVTVNETVVIEEENDKDEINVSLNPTVDVEEVVVEETSVESTPKVVIEVAGNVDVVVSPTNDTVSEEETVDQTNMEGQMNMFDIPEEDAEATRLRAELASDVLNDDKIDELAEDFRHLEEDDDFHRRSPRRRK